MIHAVAHKPAKKTARIGRPARIAELKRGIHQSVVALLAARRSRIKVKDIPIAAFVIISPMSRKPRATMRATSRGSNAS